MGDEYPNYINQKEGSNISFPIRNEKTFSDFSFIINTKFHGVKNY